jgi:hypothetical protein
MQYGTKGLLGEKFADIEEKYDLNEAAEGFGEEGEDDAHASDDREEDADASDDGGDHDDDTDEEDADDNKQDNESGSEFFEGEAF